MHKFTSEEAVQVWQDYDVSGLKGKSVIVTGGASGLGEEIARQFVQAGAFVTIADVSSERGHQIVSELGETNAAFAQCDVLSWTEQVAAFKTAIARSPSHGIDVVVANAGIAGPDTTWRDDTNGNDTDEPIEPDLSILQTNLIGVFYTTKLAIHYLVRNTNPSGPSGNSSISPPDKCLILTSSLAAYIDQPGTAQYNASKFGVRGLMRTLRRTSLSLPIPVRVNCLAPWYIQTRILPDEIAGVLQSRGVTFADKRDAGAAAVRIAADEKMHGRTLCIVQRDFAPEGRRDLQPTGKGYVDLERDDFDEGDTLTKWQDLVVRASHRT